MKFCTRIKIKWDLYVSVYFLYEVQGNLFQKIKSCRQLRKISNCFVIRLLLLSRKSKRLQNYIIQVRPEVLWPLKFQILTEILH